MWTFCQGGPGTACWTRAAGGFPVSLNALMIAATSARVSERDDPWSRGSGSMLVRARRARGVLSPRESSGVAGTLFWLFGTAERNARRTSRGTRRLDRSPWTLSRRPSPSTTRSPVKVARRTSVRAFAGHHSARASRVPRRASSARPEDPLTPSRLPRSRVRRQPHPGAALHPHPGTVVHEPRIRGETRHARVRRTFAPAALPTRCPRSAPTVPRPRPSVSG
jgi:hypothetical protein